MASFVQTQAPAWDASPPAATTITVGSGASRALFSCVTWSGTGSISGVSSNVNGAFSLVTGSLNTQTSGGRTQGIVWYVLLNPTSGGHTITASVTGSVNTMEQAVTECTAVHQTTPYGTPVIADSVAASFNHIITGTVVGDLAISGCNNGDTATLAQTAITVGDQRWEVLETAFWGTTSIGGTRDGAAGSTTITYNPLRTEGSALSGFAIKDATVIPTAVLGGSILSATTEDDIVAGGKTITLTVSGTTWVP